MLFDLDDKPRRTMGSHQSAVMRSEVWLTPPHILEALGEFDLDPCAAPEPRPWPTAKRHIALPEDGLSADWGVSRVFLNPPYSSKAVKWLGKMAMHSHGTALVFARTETEWFFETVWRAASAVLFLEGRLYFHRANGERAKANAGAPSCLVAYGQKDARILGMCGLRGAFVKL